MRKLGNRFSEHDLIMEALEAIRLCISEGRTARNAEHGTAICERGSQAGKSVAEAAWY